MTRNFIKIGAIALFISAFTLEVKAQCDSVNAELSGKIRYLGGWDANGKPDYLEPNPDAVSPEIIDFVNSVVPESVNITNSGYFKEDVQANTELLDTGKVWITYVHEGAGWNNAFGFYTYDLDNPPATWQDIDSLTIVFPNVDRSTTVTTGDQVYLGEFPPNTGIGYFLIARGWKSDTVCIGSHLIFSEKSLNTITAPQYRQHSILLNNDQNDKLLLGIEDQLRPSGDKDFNDIVFNIRVTPFDAIDTTNIPKIPTAHISGDTALCAPEDKAEIKIRLSGNGPWTVTYNNGIENITVEDIQDTVYTFETAIKGKITLVEVRDRDGMGLVSGEANVTLAETAAAFNTKDLGLCESSSGKAKINLSGTPPYDITYTDGTNVTALTDIQDSMIEIDVEAGKTYYITEVADAHCTKIDQDTLNVTQANLSKAVVTGGGIVCDDSDQLPAMVTFEGQQPFTLIYEINGDKDTLETSSSSAEILLSHGASLTPLSLSDANCVGEVEGSAAVELRTKPTAELTGSNMLCENDSVYMQASFTGSAPFTFTVSNGSVEETFTSETNEFEFYLQDQGDFEIISFEDAHCSGTATGNVEIDLLDAPLADVTGGGSVCDGLSTIDANVEFEGPGPYSFVYDLNGTKDTTTTTENNIVFTLSPGDKLIPISIFNDNCNGILTGLAEVVANDQPTVSLNLTDSICGTSATADLVLEFTGTAPFNIIYELNDTEIEETIIENTFTLELKDEDYFELTSFNDATCPGNIDNDNNWVFYHEAPTAKISGSTNICGGDLASIEINFTGKAPWKASISNGGVTENIVSSNPTYIFETNQAGTYELLDLTDEYCSGSVSGFAEVGAFDKPTAILTGESAICGDTPAVLTVAFTGDAPYSFTLTNGSVSQDYQTSDDKFHIPISDEGLYSISTLADAHCTGTATGEVNVQKFSKPAATISGGGEICGDEAVTVTIELTGTPPFDVSYTNGNEIFDFTTSDNLYTFQTSTAGTYELLSVENESCVGEVAGEAVVNNVLDDLNAGIQSSDQFCEGDDINISLAIEGAFDQITWSTSGSGSFTDLHGLVTAYVPGDEESGTIEIVAAITTACGAKEVSKTIEITPLPSADFTTDPEELLAGVNIFFEATKKDYDGYEWDFDDGATDFGSSVTHTYSEPGIYSVKLTVTNGPCSGQGEAEIEVKTKNDLFVPNVFNPNALNEENQQVKVYGTNVSESNFSFKIVNRWGNIMYETNSFAEANSRGWKGEEFNNEEMQALSAFTYVLRGQFKDGEAFEQTGTITLLR